MNQNAYSVYADPDGVDARLADLGLTKSVFVDTIIAAQGAAATVTAHHPKGFAGTILWGEAVKELRDILAVAASRWVADDDKNQPLVISPDGRIALTASCGDSATGIASRRPKTRNPKGSVTRNAAQSNNRYLWLAHEFAELARLEKLNRRETWILLLFQDEKERQIRSELSRPIWRPGLAERPEQPKNQISEWSDRIVLPVVPFGDDGATARRRETEPDAGGELTAPVQVEIRRRA